MNNEQKEMKLLNFTLKKTHSGCGDTAYYRKVLWCENIVISAVGEDFLCRPLTLMSAEQCPIPGSLKSRSRGLEPGTKAGIRSSRSPTAFRNCTSNSDSGCRDKNQRNSCSEMRKLLAFYRENHKHMIKKHLIGYKSKLKKWDTLNVYF